MATTVTVKGQVTLPKGARETAGIKPGDRVEVRAAGEGRVIIERSRPEHDYAQRLGALAKRRLVKGLSADELMELTRGEPRAPRRAKHKPKIRR